MLGDASDGRASWERLLARAALLPSLALFVPLLVPLFTGRVFSLDDLAVFHIPLRAIYQDALAGGHSLLWTPYLFNGFYVHAEGQVGALHPLHLALYCFLPFAAAFNIELVASYVWAFTGMWLFLRRTGVNGAGSLIGAMAYAFSGFNLLHLPHMNAVAIASHVPWLLTAIDALQSGEKRPAAFAAIALLVGSQVLLGYPQYVWISALTCALYALVAIRGPGGWRQTAVAGAGAALGLGIGAAQLLPTLDLFSASVRTAASHSFLTSFSLHPLNVLQFWSPYLFEQRVYAPPDELFIHELGAYNGALSTCAVVWVLVRRRHVRLRRLMRFGAVLCAAGLLLAIGRYGPVYEYFSLLPVIGTFRAPARYLLIVHFGLALLLAVTMDDVARVARERMRPTGIPLGWMAVTVGLSAATAVWAWAASSFGVGASHLSVAGALGGVILFAVAAQLLCDAARGSRTALLILPLFMAVDLGVYGHSYVWSRPPQTVADVARAAEVPPPANPDATVHIGNLDARRNLTLLHGYGLFRPYVGLVPLKTLDAETPAAQRLGGVGWTFGDTGWMAVSDPVTRARVPPEVRYSQRMAEDVATIDVSRVALTSVSIEGLQSPAAATVGVVVDDPGRMEIEVDAPARALMTTTESYHPGWKAHAAGRELRTAAVYGDHLGVVLEPGRYRVSLRFAPNSARYGIALSALALLLTAAAGAVLRRRCSD